MDQEDPIKGKKAPSLKKANEIYAKNKDPKAVYPVDASTVDLNFLDVSSWEPGSVHNGVQTLFSSKNGLVFGRLNLKYLGNNQVKILDDIYDFNYNFSTPPKTSDLFTFRNFATALGLLNAGLGVPFTFTFTGVNTIKPVQQPLDPRNGLF